VADGAKVIDGKTVEVRGADSETQHIVCEHLLLATGSTRVDFPYLPFGGTVGLFYRSPSSRK